jgi:hypothetical protein
MLPNSVFLFFAVNVPVIGIETALISAYRCGGGACGCARIAKGNSRRMYVSNGCRLLSQCLEVQAVCFRMACGRTKFRNHRIHYLG